MTTRERLDRLTKAVDAVGVYDAVDPGGCGATPTTAARICPVCGLTHMPGMVECPTAKRSECTSIAGLRPGVRVRKTGGSFTATGTVVGVFTTTAGLPRLVLEFDCPKGMLHIYRPDQVEPEKGAEPPSVPEARPVQDGEWCVDKNGKPLWVVFEEEKEKNQ